MSERDRQTEGGRVCRGEYNSDTQTERKNERKKKLRGGREIMRQTDKQINKQTNRQIKRQREEGRERRLSERTGKGVVESEGKKTTSTREARNGGEEKETRQGGNWNVKGREK